MKRGQMKISFGMIFSIILIIIFLAFAFFAIKTFLGFGDSARTGKFVSGLQTDVNKVWKSSQSSEKKEYDLPSKIKYVCFVDFDIGRKGTGDTADFYDELKRAYYVKENMIFYPFGSSEIESSEIKNINLPEITIEENPVCIKNIDGKIELTLKKDFKDPLVTITK